MVDFLMLAKDYKESWAEHSEWIEKIKKAGFTHSVDVGGNQFGIDGDFMLFSDSEEVYRSAENLVQAGYFEVGGEEFDKPVLAFHKEDEKGNLLLSFRSGEQHRMMVLP